MKKNATKDFKDFIYTEKLIRFNAFTHISDWSNSYNLLPIPSKAIIIDNRSEVAETIANLSTECILDKEKILQDFEVKYEYSKRFIVYTGSEKDLKELRNKRHILTENNVKLYTHYLTELEQIDKLIQFTQFYALQDMVVGFQNHNKEIANRIIDTIENPVIITNAFPFIA